MPGSLPDSAVHMHFKYTTTDRLKKPIAECLLCHEYRKTRNTSWQKQHLLEECLEYHNFIKSKDQPEPKKKQQTIESLVLPRMDPIRKARIDQKIAKAIYVSSKPFTLFEDQEWLEVWQEFGYTPPTRQALSRPLLDQTYSKVEKDVEFVLSSSSFVNLITDESTDINMNRMINYSFTTNDGNYFYWLTTEASEGSQNAARITEQIIETAKRLTHGQLLKIHSLTTDTCPTMQAVWKNLQNNPEMKHMFMVPCDSHGLQLLIKDLLLIPNIEQVWKLASNIVNSLRNALKQYAFLQT